MPNIATVGGLVATVLAAGEITLARWQSHVHGTLSDLRERVARLEVLVERKDDDEP